jgi:adenylate cyclase
MGDVMAENGFKRKLAAILSADVKGYSRLMGEDEDATVSTLTAYREIMTTLIKKHQGRVVDSPGDNLLAEFTSVVNAMRCAVKTQDELKIRNDVLPENRKMEFRIGVHLGDVIVEGERIYGDGVNMAARLEGLAEGGGITISGTVYDSIENKLDLNYKFQGEHTVKNIKKPVRVYRVRKKSTITFSGDDREYELPDRPSIAVLPFVNISGDPEQEYFSDGITEDLITDLSKVSGLFVIARNSVFTFKGMTVKVKELGKKLGVRYVLEGSVRKAGNRVRITAQLVDANTEGHLWAERYDRDLIDIFSLQDEVTQKIVAALTVKLTEDEQERLFQKDTNNLEAYNYNLRGLESIYRWTKESMAEARQMLEKAINIDPEYASAYSNLGKCHWADWANGWSQGPQSLEQAFELSQRAIALDDSLTSARIVLSDVYLWKRLHDQAIAVIERAVKLNPNYADAIEQQGEILIWAGRPQEGMELVRKAMRFNPIYPVWYLWNLGHAYFFADQHEEAIEILKRALIINPDFLPVHLLLALIYAEKGWKEAAKVEVAEIPRISPETYSLKALCQRLPYKDQAVSERVIEGLRKVGIPE